MILAQLSNALQLTDLYGDVQLCSINSILFFKYIISPILTMVNNLGTSNFVLHYIIQSARLSPRETTIVVDGWLTGELSPPNEKRDYGQVKQFAE